MGVSGSGKTSVGTALAQRLDIRFIEGDSLHRRANIEKMSRGIPPTDDDRWPWLDRIGDALSSRRKARRGPYRFLFGVEAQLSRAPAWRGGRARLHPSPHREQGDGLRNALPGASAISCRQDFWQASWRRWNPRRENRGRSTSTSRRLPACLWRAPCVSSMTCRRRQRPSGAKPVELERGSGFGHGGRSLGCGVSLKASRTCSPLGRHAPLFSKPRTSAAGFPLQSIEARPCAPSSCMRQWI